MPDDLIQVRYASGELARIGDRVDHDGWQSVVDDVIDTPEKFALWGVDETGLMLRCKEAGLVYVHCASRAWNTIVFQTRAESTG